MSFATIKKKTKDGGYAATFGIRLESIFTLPVENRQEPARFALDLMGRQMDFIHSLHGLPIDYAIDLRYLFDPARPDLIQVCCLVNIRTDDASDAALEPWRRHFMNKLQINSHLHRFAPVSDMDDLRYLVAPFEPAGAVEIIRREDAIALDAMRGAARKRLGFTPKTAPPGRDPAGAGRPHIYYVFPYAMHIGSMERLCNTLLMQNSPCLVSICMRPYALSPEDEDALEARIHKCEKYAQLGLNAAENPERLQPFLKKQAEALYKNCVRDLTRLQDAAFLLKVQIVSPDPAPFEVITETGTALTEHAGNPVAAFSDDTENAFIGGYEWRAAETPQERRVALDNFKNMRFAPWVPSQAPAGFTHFRCLFDVCQAAAAFRLPFPLITEFPGIDTIQHLPKPAPSDLAAKGMLIGRHVHLHRRRNVYYDVQDRLRHTYVVGQTGTGKSTLFMSMILQDIRDGRGVGLIDPHGELISEIMPSIPGRRAGDVIFINPMDYERPAGINMLDHRTPFEKDFCVNYLIEVFDALYNLKETGGPIFEMYMRNALQLLLDQPVGPGPTVLDVPRVLQNRDFRRQLLRGCTNPYVKDFWEKEADKAGGDMDLRNVAPYITSKLTRFVYNDIIRCTLGQRQSTFDFKALMNEGKILLVDLSKGFLGETNSHFLGMILVGKLLAAALSRAEIADKSKRRPFFLYVDEFQNLATKTFVTILSEARKYGLALTVTNQYISQLRDYIIYGLMGNVGTLVSFRVGSDDAELLAKEFGHAVSQNDLMGLPNWQAYIRLLNNGEVSAPFNIHTFLPKLSRNRRRADEIISRSRMAYGRERNEVEKDIQTAWDIDGE